MHRFVHCIDMFTPDICTDDYAAHAKLVYMMMQNSIHLHSYGMVYLLHMSSFVLEFFNMKLAFTMQVYKSDATVNGCVYIHKKYFSVLVISSYTNYMGKKTLKDLVAYSGIHHQFEYTSYVYTKLYDKAFV